MPANCFSLILCLLLVSSSLSRQYPTDLADIHDIKLQPHQQITFSPFPGVMIDRLSIKQVVGDSSYYSTLCKVIPATMKAKIKAVQLFETDNSSNKILSSLEDLKNFRTAIDLTHWKSKYYVMFKSGMIETYTYSQKQKIITKSNTITYKKEVSSGYFVNTTDTLWYVSGDELLRISQDQITQIRNYGPHSTFVYPFLADQNTLYVSLPDKIIKYTFKENIIQSTIILIVPSELNEIVDFSYDANRQLFVVLDYKKGVYFLKQSNNDALLTISEKYIIDIVNCQNLIYKNSFVYVTCPNLFRYNMDTLLLEKQDVSIYPEDLMVTDENQIILKGSSHIVYFRRWEARPTMTELVEPHRFVFDRQNIVYINNHQIIQQEIKIRSDRLKCSPDETHKAGLYIINVFSAGVCQNPNQPTVTTSTMSNNTCLYVRNIDVEVWVAHEIYWVIMEIGFVLVVALSIIPILWCSYKRIMLKRKQKEYSELNEEKQPQEQGYLSSKPKMTLEDQSTHKIETEGNIEEVGDFAIQ